MVHSIAIINDSFLDLDSWARRAASNLVPLDGSELAGDDADWPPMRTSEIARSGLAAAVDHLKALRVTMVAGELFPFAQLSLLRAGLLGSAQAVWVLGPDDRDERIRRSRMAAGVWHEEHRKALEALMRCDGGRTAEAVIAQAISVERRDQIQSIRRASGDAEKYQSTKVIEVAIRAAFKEDRFVDEGLYEWRRMSGTAHGWSWSALGQTSTKIVSEPDEHGVAYFSAAGDLGAITNPLRLVYWMTTKGWALLDQRSGLT